MFSQKAFRRLSIFLSIIFIVSLLPSHIVNAKELYSSNPTTINSSLTENISFQGTTYPVTVDYDMAWEVLDLINKERNAQGLSSLKMDKELMDTAIGRAAETTVSFSHTRPDGSSCFSVYPSNQWTMGENIAAGYSSPSSVVNGWMNSSGHRANILNSSFNAVGIGCAKTNSGYYIYWAQCFGSTVNNEVKRGSKNVDYSYYSSIFDPDYYLAKYSDLRKAYGNDTEKALNHFLNYGMKEGRQASPNFDVFSYKNKYPDLRIAFGNDLKKYYIHYIEHGKKENRIATGVSTLQNPVTSYNGVDYKYVYDFNYYQKNNSDIKKAYGNDDVATLRHFINYGMKEGRQASPYFNVSSYKNKYADLRLAYGNDLTKYYMHYINHGKKEGRVATGVSTLQNPVTSYNGVDYKYVYDFNYYQSKNSDIKKAYGNDDIATLQHFIKYGMNEGRIASAKFNVKTYKENYADLRKSYGDNYSKYYMHYINHGYKEGRNAIDNINPLLSATWEPEQEVSEDISIDDSSTIVDDSITIEPASPTDAD